MVGVCGEVIMYRAKWLLIAAFIVLTASACAAQYDSRLARTDSKDSSVRCVLAMRNCTLAIQLRTSSSMPVTVSTMPTQTTSDTSFSTSDSHVCVLPSRPNTRRAR